MKDKLLKGGGNRGVVKCRICKEDHWTTNCPYKDTLGPMRDALAAGTGLYKFVLLQFRVMNRESSDIILNVFLIDSSLSNENELMKGISKMC